MAGLDIWVGMGISAWNSGVARIRTDITSLRGQLNSVDAGGALASKLIGGLGAILGLGALKEFATAMMDEAGAIQDRADNLDLNVESMQRLQGVLGEAGVDAGQFEKAIIALNDKQKAAVEGNKEAEKAFAKLGVTWGDLKSQGPEALFYQLAEGAKASGAAASDLAEIFGTKLGPKLAGAMKQGAEGIREAGKEIEIMSAATVARLDELGDRIGRTWNNAKLKLLEYIFAFKDMHSDKGAWADISELKVRILSPEEMKSNAEEEAKAIAQQAADKRARRKEIDTESLEPLETYHQKRKRLSDAYAKAEAEDREKEAEELYKKLTALETEQAKAARDYHQANADADEQAALKRLTTEQQILELRRLQAEAVGEQDFARAGKYSQQANALEAQKKAPAMGVADSLRSVGGGGGYFAPSILERTAKHAEEQTKLQAKILQAIEIAQKATFGDVIK